MSATISMASLGRAENGGGELSRSIILTRLPACAPLILVRHMDASTIFLSIGFPLFLFFIALGAGTVVAMSNSESAGFILARGCFILSAVTLISFSSYWIYVKRLTFETTTILSAGIGLLAVPGLSLSLWWVRDSEERLSTQLFPDILPSPKIPELPKRETIPDNALIVAFGTNISRTTSCPT